jgi:hypothetical protein
MSESADGYESIRAEIAAAQKTRDQLMKWKLLIVAAVGAAALGFSEKAPRGAPLALIVIPFACAYVDLLCRNLSLRSKSASRFLADESHREQSPTTRREVAYWHEKKKRGQSLESIALLGSSIILSLATGPVGIAAFSGSNKIEWYVNHWPNGLFYASSAVGVASAVVVQFLYRRQKKLL